MVQRGPVSALGVASRVRSVWHLVVTVLLAPGLVAHEYGHYLACRALGVEVRARPSPNLIGGAAHVDHAAVDSFLEDLAIAAAPLVVNSGLALLAFAVAFGLPEPTTDVAVWVGASFALTAVPSEADTADLFATAESLPERTRPVAYLLAAPLRAISRSPVVAGLAAAGWMALLYAASAGLVP